MWKLLSITDLRTSIRKISIWRGVQPRPLWRGRCANAAQAVHDGGPKEEATEPQSLVTRPDAERAFMRYSLDILEAGLAQLVGNAVNCVQL